MQYTTTERGPSQTRTTYNYNGFLAVSGALLFEGEDLPLLVSLRIWVEVVESDLWRKWCEHR